MYWADYGLDKVERADLDGSNRQVLATGNMGDPVGVDADDNGTIHSKLNK